MSNKNTFKFDKFIKDIRQREEKSRKDIQDRLSEQDESPQRKLIKLYHEKWQNSIRYRRKK